MGFEVLKVSFNWSRVLNFHNLVSELYHVSFRNAEITRLIKAPRPEGIALTSVPMSAPIVLKHDANIEEAIWKLKLDGRRSNVFMPNKFSLFINPFSLHRKFKLYRLQLVLSFGLEKALLDKNLCTRKFHLSLNMFYAKLARSLASGRASRPS
jgi:hypothetical protein